MKTVNMNILDNFLYVRDGTTSFWGKSFNFYSEISENAKETM